MKLKDSLIIYLPQRIILFPLHLYINSLITNVLNSLYDWDIGVSKKITGREKFFKYFLENEILNIFKEIKIVYKDVNIKIFTFYKDIEISKEVSSNLSDDNIVLSSVLKKIKKISGKYYIDKMPNNLNFFQSKNIFKNLKCGQPTGEELEFLIKISSN